MKLWKSKKLATTSCVSAVSGKLNLGGNKNAYKDDDQTETISAAATPTNQSNHQANGLHQGETFRSRHCSILANWNSPRPASTRERFHEEIFFVRLCKNSFSETLDSRPNKISCLVNHRMIHRCVRSAAIVDSIFKFSTCAIPAVRQPCIVFAPSTNLPNEFCLRLLCTHNR